MNSLPFGIGILVAVGGSAFGSIVENINSTKSTFHYFLKDSKVYIERCEGLPESNLDLSLCKSVTSKGYNFGPLDLKEFEAKVVEWAGSDLDKIGKTISIAEAQREQKRKILAETEEIIQSLPAGSPALPDYLDRRSDLTKTIIRLETQISTAEGQLNGLGLVLGPKGYLAQELIHPVADNETTYLLIRPYVKHLYEVFKYRKRDPNRSVIDAKNDLARFKASGQKPYCAYWNGGFGDQLEIDSERHGVIRTFVSAERTEPFKEAGATCEALGLKLPVASHVPGYHSHLWARGSREETWTVQKSVALFAESELAKGLSKFDFMGRELLIFWVQIPWTSKFHKPGDPDGFFMSPNGDWFRFNDGEDEGGRIITARKIDVDPNWRLSVLCEKEYPRLPRFIGADELPDCVEYRGWP